MTRAKSASGPGRFAWSGRTRAPDQARTAPALVNRAILAIALMLPYHSRQAEWIAAIPPLKLRYRTRSKPAFSINCVKFS